MSTFDLSNVPFSAKDALFTRRLHSPNHSSTNSRSSMPSSRANVNEEPLSYVPGEPRVKLASEDVQAFFVRELHTPLLDDLYTRLWLVARRDSGNIDPLHRQKIKGRQILLTEDPKLHLIWRRDKIYIKPVPLCLLSHQFWTDYLCRSSPKQTIPSSITSSTSEGKEGEGESAVQQNDYAVALGFLRSYASLISHYSDFQIARENHLFPVDLEWTAWCTFIANFGAAEDHQVAKRYHYGQLRLSRLNWVVRIFQPYGKSTSWFYEIPHWNITSYLHQSIVPLVFSFASISLVLSAMQVILSVPTDRFGMDQLDDNISIRIVSRAFWVFSIIVLLLSGAIWTLMLLLPLCGLMWQLLWGFRHRRKL